MNLPRPEHLRISSIDCQDTVALWATIVTYNKGFNWGFPYIKS